MHILSDHLEYPWTPKTDEDFFFRARVEIGLVASRGMDVAGLELERERGRLWRNSSLSYGSKSVCQARCPEFCRENICPVISILPCPPKHWNLLRRASSLRLCFDKKAEEEHHPGSEDEVESSSLTWILLAALLIERCLPKSRMGSRIPRMSWTQIPLLRGAHRTLLQHVRPHRPAPIRARVSHPRRAHAAGNWDTQRCLERPSECRRSCHSKRSTNSYFSGSLFLFHGFRNRVVLSFQIEARWLGIRTTMVGKRKEGLGVGNWGH